MIQIEKEYVYGWEAAVRGLRNPMNSWDKSDSLFHYMVDDDKPEDFIGKNDLGLMTRLANAGPDHGKFLRMITVTADITAPLYWWKEYDTYKVGTVANSCSTMHRIHEREFTINDFSIDKLIGEWTGETSQVFIYGQYSDVYSPKTAMMLTIEMLNACRNAYLNTKDKKYWWQMIQLLPTSYNQRRTVMLNYQVLKNMYHARNAHKLDEWRTFCEWVETLPYAKELITG